MVLAQLNAMPLEKTKIDKLVGVLCEEILLRVRPIQLILFGSAASLEMTEYSDLDIMVVVEHVDEIRKCSRALPGVSSTLYWPVSIVAATEISETKPTKMPTTSTSLEMDCM